MHDLINNNSLNLLEKHVFQFDFLNDPFTKLPQPLQDIINDPEKRKKLVIYINPPYAEAGDSKQLTGTGKNKTDVAVTTNIYKRYLPLIGIAGRELFAQFLIRVYHEIPSSVLAEFSKLKILQAPNFRDFRNNFQAKLNRLFLVPASTFDNVKGKFPIGFFIWDLNKSHRFKTVEADVYDTKCNFIGKKNIYSLDNEKGLIGDWVLSHKDEHSLKIGFMSNGRNDFQNQKLVYFMNKKEQMPTPRGWWITPSNLNVMCIFVAVRHCIEATWLNDRDQFLYPNNGWQTDVEFQTDCLAYALFSNSNTIQCKQGTNHWIPFTEQEVDAKEKFESHFMTEYMQGKVKSNAPVQTNLFEQGKENRPLLFSPEAQAVLDAGRELWRYYHAQPDANPNAALYDIRLHFQGTNAKGKMNAGSDDARYTELIAALRQHLKQLARKIEPKVYEYGFLVK